MLRGCPIIACHFKYYLLLNMSREQWCIEKSQLLRTADDRVPILSDIKNYVANLSQDEAKEATFLLQLPLVFDCLNDSNDEQIELTCEVLTICLNSLELGESTVHFYTDLGRALNHPHPHVKSMALKEILRDVRFIPKSTNLANYKTLLGQVIHCIADNNLSVATLACDVTIEVGKTPDGIQILSSQEISPALNEVMMTNEVVRMRLFDVIINIAKSSPHTIKEVDQTGFLQKVIDELDNSDILVQLSVIELLSTLVDTDYGYTYLESYGVILKLCDSLKNTDNVLYLQLCEPGILKFFGHVAHRKPNVLIEKYPFVLNRLFENLESSEDTTLGVAMNTLSYIVDTDSCKIKMDKVGDDLYKAITKIVEGLGIYRNDIKVKALNCLANFLNVSSNDRKVTEITKKWYGYMQVNPMDWIMRYAKNPFSELRMSGLGILNSLAKQYWGHEVLRNTPGLIEFLLDRNIETIKECKEMKYEIIKKLADSPVFNNEMQKLMQNFVREGPFYVQGVTEIALEGED